MRPEKQQLIHDLLNDESRQEATVLEGAKILRRRRHSRIAFRIGMIFMLAVAAALLMEQNRRGHTVAANSPAITRPIAATRSQSLTDDQLLSLFPNTPVALATLPNGKKLLIFPRPSDRSKYTTRL